MRQDMGVDMQNLKRRMEEFRVERERQAKETAGGPAAEQPAAQERGIDDLTDEELSSCETIP